MAVCDRCCFETFCEHGVLRVVGVKESVLLWGEACSRAEAASTQLAARRRGGIGAVCAPSETSAGGNSC